MQGSVARCTMKAFVENINGDEEMLKFAAENMDADEDDIVEITIRGSWVTYKLIPKDQNDAA